MVFIFRILLKLVLRIRPVRKRIKRFCANIIQRRILKGKTVYFESLLEELAFKYIPGSDGDEGKYFAKFYRQNEFEIESNSSAVSLGVNEGLLISRQRYDRYHLIKGDHWNRVSCNPVSSVGFRQAGT